MQMITLSCVKIQFNTILLQIVIVQATEILLGKQTPTIVIRLHKHNRCKQTTMNTINKDKAVQYCTKITNKVVFIVGFHYCATEWVWSRREM